MTTPELSIIIPCLQEAANIRRLLASLPLERDDLEVIVVDAGSNDGTQIAAASFPVRVVRSEASRGNQIWQGATLARAPRVWLLHADSVLPERGHVEAILDSFRSNPALVGGNFALEFLGDSAFSQWLTRFYRRIRKLGLYYGDSGMFLQRDVLLRYPKFSEMSVLEDFYLCRKMERDGPTVCIERPWLATSSRRFVGRKKSHIIWGWVWVHLLHTIGVPNDRIAKIYDSARRREGRR